MSNWYLAFLVGTWFKWEFKERHGKKEGDVVAGRKGCLQTLFHINPELHSDIDDVAIISPLSSRTKIILKWDENPHQEFNWLVRLLFHSNEL